MRHYMSELVKGWDVDTVRQIVAETLDDIVDPMVYEEAVDLKALEAVRRAAGVRRRGIIGRHSSAAMPSSG